MPRKKTETPVPVPSELALELAAQKTDLSEALPAIRNFAIVTSEDVAFAEESRALVKDQWTLYEGKRTEITVPLNAAKAAVDRLFAPVLKGLKEVEVLWSRKILDARAAKEDERQALIAEARLENEPEVLKETLVAAADARIELTQSSAIEHWVFEITDPDAVPRDFCCPDLKKIGAIVGAMHAQTAIPGVRAFNDPYLRDK